MHALAARGATIPHTLWTQSFDSKQGTEFSAIVALEPGAGDHVFLVATNRRPEWAGIQVTKISAVDGTLVWERANAHARPGYSTVLATRTDERGDLWIAGARSDSVRLAPPQKPFWMKVAGSTGELVEASDLGALEWDSAWVMRAAFLPGSSDMVFVGHGFDADPAPPGQLQVARLSPGTGEVVWRTNCRVPAWETNAFSGWPSLHIALEAGSGDVLITGRPLEKGPPQPPLQYLARLDARTGAVVWEQTIQRTDVEGLSFGRMLSDTGAIYLVGESRSSREGERKLDVMRIDPANGRETWHVRRAGLGATWSLGNSMALLPGGGLWITAMGLRFDPGAGQDLRDLVVFRFQTADGSEEWVQRLPVADPFSYPVATQLIGGNAADGLVAWLEYGGTGSSLHVARLEASTGTAKWTKSFPSRAWGDDSQFSWHGFPMPGGRWILAGADSGKPKQPQVMAMEEDQGSVIWTRHLESPGSGEDHPSFLVSDRAGDVVTIGRSSAVLEDGSGFGVSSGFVVKQRGSDGALLWQQEFLPAGRSLEFVQASVDAAGHVLLVTGEYGIGAVLRQWDGAVGRLRWESRVEMPDAPLGVGVSAVVLDASSLVVGISGWRTNASTQRLVKLDRNDGRMIWSAPTPSVEPVHLAVAGESGISVMDENPPALAQYRSGDGTIAWQRLAVRFSEEHGNAVSLRCLALDAAGDLYTFGAAEPQPGRRIPVLARFSRLDGSCLWSRNVVDAADAVTVAEDGVLRVASGTAWLAQVRLTGSTLEWILQARSLAEGQLLWTQTWRDSSSQPILDVDAEGRLLVFRDARSIPPESGEGTVHLAALDPTTGRIDWDWTWGGFQRGPVHAAALVQTPWGLALACANASDRSRFRPASDLATAGLRLSEVPELRMIPEGAAGRLRIRALGSPAQVERSEDLRAWHAVGAVQSAGQGDAQFQDSSPPPGSSFYRLRLESP